MKYWELITIETDGMFFFTTDHNQGVRDRVNYILRNERYRLDEDPGLRDLEIFLEEDFVPVTYRFPQTIAPREGLEDGVINTIEKFIEVFHKNDLLIMNPDARYQPRLYKCSKGHTTTSPGQCFCFLFPKLVDEWKDTSKAITQKVL